MSRSHPICALFLVLIVLLTLAAAPAQAPVAPPPELPSDPQFQRERNRQVDPHEERWRKELEKRRNEERHESLKRDTDKLHQLATELKEYVEKSSEDMLSLEVVRKAEQIEKLAKNVQKKMKGR